MFHAFDAGGDELLDLLGGFSGAPGQGPHFAGHHGKAAALLAGTRRLDGSIQGQDIGLESDAVNDADDVGNLVAAFVDALHGLDHLGDHLSPLGRHGRCIHGHLVGLASIVGILLDRGPQLLHGCSGLLQRAGLFLGSAGQIAIAHGDLSAARSHPLGIAAHRRHRVHQTLLHALQCMQQLPCFVLRLHRDLAAEITASHTVCRSHRQGQRTGDGSGDRDGKNHRQNNGDCASGQYLLEQVVGSTFRLLAGHFGVLRLAIQQLADDALIFKLMGAQLSFQQGQRFLSLAPVNQPEKLVARLEKGGPAQLQVLQQRFSLSRLDMLLQQIHFCSHLGSGFLNHGTCRCLDLFSRENR